MIPIALDRSIVVIPKSEPTNIDVYVYNEFTKEEVISEDIAFSYSGGYLLFNYDQSTDIDMQYTIKIVERNTNEVIFKGKCIGVASIGTALFINGKALIINTNQGLFI